MIFKLEQDNNNSSDDDLITDLISVSKRLGKMEITRKEYNEYGRYSEGTLRKRFGGWLNALEKAGLSSKRSYVNDLVLLDELKRVFHIANVDVLSKDTFNRFSTLSNSTTIERRFGSWKNALEKAGIIISSSQLRYTKNDLFENILNVWTFLGRQPYIKEMDQKPSYISSGTYSNHFGSWRKALESFIVYINEDHIDPIIQTEPLVEKAQNKPIKHKTNRTINLRLRFLVLKADNFSCRICGNSPAKDPNVILHVDHIIPWSKGGETIFENLQTLCSKCNRACKVFCVNSHHMGTRSP